LEISKFGDADPGIEYDGHPADSVLYLAGTTRGTTIHPVILDVAEDCPNAIIIGPYGTPFEMDRTFQASREIMILGDWIIPVGTNITFSVPKLMNESQLNISFGATVIVRPDGCQ